jgi:hypothetical protein
LQVGLVRDLFAFFYIHFRRLIIAFGFLAAISAVSLYLAEIFIHRCLENI